MRRLALSPALLAALVAGCFGLWRLLAEGPSTEDRDPSSSREVPWTSLPPRFTLRGTVKDEGGRPVAGVRVGIRRAGDLAWDMKEPDPRRRSVDFGARASWAMIEESPRVAPPWNRVLDADAEGRFEVGVPDEATYELAALPEGARIGLRRYATARPEESEALVLHVADARVREGRVLDAQGRPVDGVVRGWVVGTTSSLLEPCPIEPATGAFRVRVPGASRLLLRIVRPGSMACDFAAVPGDAAGPIVLDLPSSLGSVEGQVRGPDGRGVGGARVVLHVRLSRAVAAAEDHQARVLLRANAAGVFRGDGVPTGLVGIVSVLAPGLVLSAVAERNAVEGRSIREDRLTRLDLVLESGGSVEGRVLDEDSRAAVAGASVGVWVTENYSLSAHASTVSGEDGGYRVEGLPSGRVTLLPSGPEVVPTSVLRRLGARSPRPWEGAVLPTDDVLLLPPGGAARSRDLTVRPGLKLRGTVLGADGEPAPDVPVTWVDPDLPWPWTHLSRWAVTDADGHFTLEGVPPSPFLLVTAAPAGAPVAVSEPIDASGAPPPAPVVIRLSRGATLAGTVTDESGRRVAGASVRVRASSLADSNSTRTTAAGSFRLEGLRPGPAALSVTHLAHLDLDVEVLDLAPGEVREGLLLSMRRGVRLGGVLVDAAGEPIPGGRIRVRDPDRSVFSSRRTDEEGRFLFEDVPEGAMTLEAVRDLDVIPWGPYGRGQAFERPVTAPGEDLHVDLPLDREPRWLDLRILDPGGTPVPQCSVWHATRRPGAEDPPDPNTPHEGAFVDVLAGAVRLAFPRGREAYVAVCLARDEAGEALDAYGPVVRLPEEAPGGGEEDPIVVRLVRGRAIGGLVRSQDGRGVAGVLVSTPWNYVVTAPDGRYLLRGQPAELPRLHVEPPDGFVTPRDLEVVTGQMAYDFVLESAGSVVGRVLGPLGEPIPEGRVTAEWREASPPGRMNYASTWAAAGGWFRLGGVPRDRSFALESKGALGASNPFAPARIHEVRAGTRDALLRLQPGVVIEGMVLDTQGRPVVGASVWARSADGELREFERSQANGRFRFEGLAAGEYVLSAREGTGSTKPVEERVRAPALGVILSPARPFRCEGRVVGEGDLTPLRVEAVSDETPSTVYGSARLAADGSFLLRFAGVAPFRLVVRGDDDPRYAFSDSLDGDAADVELVLRRGGAIEGRFRSRSGALPSGLRIGARGTLWYAKVDCDDEGRFRINGLPWGRYRLEGEVPGIHQEIATSADAGARDIVLGIP